MKPLRHLITFLTLSLCLLHAEETPRATEKVEGGGTTEMRNKYPEKITSEEHTRWVNYVKSKEPEEQVWLQTLEERMGIHFFPNYQSYLVRDMIDPEKDPWAYVKDDRGLPRLLILGDSISRGYTANVRQQLKGKANVHRAPENCGATAHFIKNGEVWLEQNGSNRWDVITVNFGIHDRSTKPDVYWANLKAIFSRLRETGAKILWVRTTPTGSIHKGGIEADESKGVNEIADLVASEEGIEIIDVHGAIAAESATLLNKEDKLHWSEEGYQKIGKAVIEGVEHHLRSKQ